MAHSNPRYAGLRPNPGKLGVTPLREGEISRPVRVRAEAWVFERLHGMSSIELGTLIAGALLAAEQSGQRPASAAAPMVEPPLLQDRPTLPDVENVGMISSALPAARLPKLSGRPAQLLALLQEPGSAIELKHGVCMYTRQGKPFRTFDQGTGRHLLKINDLLAPAGEDCWVLNPLLAT